MKLGTMNPDDTFRWAWGANLHHTRLGPPTFVYPRGTLSQSVRETGTLLPGTQSEIRRRGFRPNPEKTPPTVQPCLYML